MKKMAIIIALVFSFCFIAIPAFADTVDTLTQQKSTIDSRISKIQAQKKAALAQKNQLLSEKNQIVSTQTKVTNEYKQLVTDIEVLKSNLTEIELALAEAEENYRIQEEFFRTRINIMYQNSNMSLLETFAESNGIIDFFEKLQYMSIIAENDKQLVLELNQAKLDVEYKKQLKEEAKAALETQASEKQERIAQLTASRSEVDQEIKRSTAELSTLEKEEDALLAKSKELNNTIKNLQSKGKYAGGSMVWPVPSSYNITSSFGLRKHPILRKYRQHTGIDIGAKSGVSILAANSGTVIISEYNSGGYGNYIVIDHGGGITTLYGHCSKRLVSVGDKVKAGEVIAKVGSTGLSTGPHLHFEVRVDGTPKNPMSGYLSK